MIQGAIIPAQHWFQEETFPNFVNLAALPRVGELSHDFAKSAASTASNAFTGFRTYVDNFRSGLGRHIEIPPQYPVLHRFVHGEVWPNLARPAVGVVPGRLTPRLPLAGNSGAASAAAASSAASEGLAQG